MIARLNGRALVVLVTVVAAGLGCGGPVPTRSEIGARWIEGDGVDVFNAADHRLETLVFEDLPAAAAGGRWRKTTDQGENSVGGPWVARVDMDADEIDHITVSLAHSEPGFIKARLSWAGEGERFVSDRSLVKGVSVGPIPGSTDYRFEVAGHGLWKGPIERIRLTAVYPSPLQLEKVTGERSVFKASGLPEIVGRPWQIAIANDSRHALVGVPGVPQTRQFSIPERAHLRLGYGVEGRCPSDVDFSIRLRAEGEESLLLSETVAAGEMPMLDWRKAEVDLSPWAGRQVELELMTDWKIEAGAVPTLPLWSNPEIVADVAEPKPMNVVLISIDTLRSDRLSLYGHERPTSPNLERWAAASGVVFDNAVVQASWTLPSHTSMLSGIGAFRHGVNYNSPVPADVELVSESLRPLGYKTLAVTGGGYVHPHYNLSQGFDRFWYWSGVDPSTGSPLDGADYEFDTVLDRVDTWVRECADEPFFLFLHTYDIHYRLRSREPFFSQFSDLEAPSNLRWGRVTPSAEDGFQRDKFLVLRQNGDETPLPAEMANLPSDIYDSRIAHLDSSIPRFFALLDELGLSDDTLVVLTSDHGELLGEHDLFGHLSLYEENLMVPLVIAAPGIAEPGRRITDQVRSIDIVPTILDLLGLPVPAEVEGASLAGLLREGSDAIDRPAWSYAAASNFGISLRTANQSKIIFNNTAWSPVNGEVEYYRLDEDPGEFEDFGDSSEATAKKESLVERYTEQTTGIRLAFVNPGAEPFELMVKGPILQQVGVKSIDARCIDCVTLPNRGSAVVRVDPGRRFSLVLEEIAGRSKSLTFEARSARSSAKSKRTEVDVFNDLDDGLMLIWTPDGWQRRSGTELPGDAPGLVLTRVGNWFEAESSEVDSELSERLRALGYIE